MPMRIPLEVSLHIILQIPFPQAFPIEIHRKNSVRIPLRTSLGIPLKTPQGIPLGTRL